MNVGRAAVVAKLTFTEVVVAYLLAVINGGGSINWFELAQFLLAIKLNVFAAPLMLTPALGVSYWVAYVIVVMWVWQWFVFARGPVASEVDELVVRFVGLVRGVASRPGQRVVADGGVEEGDEL